MASKPKNMTSQARLTKLVEDAEKLVVIDFHASWCEPCKDIAPKFQELSAQHNAFFVKVDVDKAEEIADQYKIKTLPTFVFIKNGKVVKKFTGANEAKLEEMTVKYA